MTKKLVRCQLCRALVELEPHPILGYVCPACLEQQDHYTSNHQEKGGWSRLPRFSVEFEVDGFQWDDLERATLLLRYGYLRTQDGSVSGEYKSPIYTDLRGFTPVLPVLEALADLVRDSCGTHLHVEFHHLATLAPNKERIFGPLLNHLFLQQTETEAFWGRYFGTYARPAFDGSRYSAFNVDSHYPTLEFRLPRFRSAGQYLRIVTFCRQAVVTMNGLLSRSPADLTHSAQDDLALRLLGQYLAATMQPLPTRKGGKAHVPTPAM
jgi:hypothetical protein